MIAGTDPYGLVYDLRAGTRIHRIKGHTAVIKTTSGYLVAIGGFEQNSEFTHSDIVTSLMLEN